MGKLLASIFGLRQDERERALLMSIYHFILLITLYLLKPVRDSLFLSDRGASELPFVFLLTTVAIVPVAVAHTRLGKKLHVGRLLDGVSLFLAASLVAMHGLVRLETAWSAYALYAWVSIYGLLVTSQFWLLANAIFTASQAKRVFTALSVGAILGAVAGGEITGLLVDVLGMRSVDLLWVAAALLTASIALSRWIRYRHRQHASSNAPSAADASPDPSAGAWTVIRNSRHVQLIVGIIAITVVTTTFVDYQFKTVASAAYPTEDALTTFMGRFYGRVSLVALVVQFVVAPRLMRILGIGGALSMLPAGLALGTLGMIAMPGLVAGVLLRGTDQSLKHSVDKTGRELLFVPVSLQKKKRVKVFIDLFVDQGAQGLGGALLLLFTVGLGFGVWHLGFVMLGLIALWGGLVYRARRSYVDQFRVKLRQQAAADRASRGAKDAPESEASEGKASELSTDLDEMLRSLCSHNETRALHALERLQDSDMRVPVDLLKCLMRHPSPAVRAEVLRTFRLRRVDGVVEEVIEKLTDTDPDVQLEAARYLYCQHTGNRRAKLQEALSHEDVRIQAAAVGLIAEEGGPHEYRLVTEAHLRRLLEVPGDEGEDARTHVARMLGVLDRSYRRDLLMELLHDDSLQVQRAAIQAAGRSGERAFVFLLLERLEHEALEKEARHALAAYGRRIQGTLFDYMTDDRVPLSVRKQIPSILSDQPCQMAVTVLERSLGRVPLPVRHSAIRALSRLHESGSYRFDADVIDSILREEAEHYAALGQILHLRLRTEGNAPDGITANILQRFRSESLERLFRLLGLRYDQRDIYNAYLGITSDDDALRSSAVEFVDNLVGYQTSKYILPLLDDPDGRQATAAGPRLFEHRIRRWAQARSYLESTDDPRLHVLLDSKGDEANRLAPVMPPAGDGHPERSTPDMTASE
jgi:ATP/ADP translocase